MDSPTTTTPTVDPVAATMYSPSGIIQSTYAHYIIFAVSIASIVWGVMNTMFVSHLCQPSFLKKESV